jgi:bifunctional enzyme CysN/CysC
LDADIAHQSEIWEEHIRRLGELARILTDSGQIFITSISDVDDYDLQTLELLNQPNEIVVVNVGENHFDDFRVNLTVSESENVEKSIDRVCDLLKDKKVILDYCI